MNDAEKREALLEFVLWLREHVGELVEEQPDEVVDKYMGPKEDDDR